MQNRVRPGSAALQLMDDFDGEGKGTATPAVLRAGLPLINSKRPHMMDCALEQVVVALILPIIA